MSPSPDAIARMRFESGRKSLLVAYLAWFFVGYVGLHRMYLGRWVSGLVMLLIFSVSWVLSLVFIGYLGLGLIFLWWVLDAVLIPGIVRRADAALINSLRH